MANCRNNISRVVLVCFLLFQSGAIFSEDSINVSILPDPFNCHQLGFEMDVTDNSTLGIIVRNACNSDRPTFGSPNDNVKNTFSRILIPFKYSTNGVFKDGFIMQPVIGLEQSKFTSTAGSEANVTFIDIAYHFGYQWFWGNGFNVAAMGGPVILIENSSSKTIVQNESPDVVKFLDENTETNIHAGVGVIFGWVF